jgi:hypothetical protein
MTIKSKPQKVAEFIHKAPDAAAKKESTVPVQITLKLSPDLLASVDAAAKAINISRAGFIKMSLSNAVKG